jgi:hypothetical protein
MGKATIQVKIMNSHDYGHFEFALSKEVEFDKESVLINEGKNLSIQAQVAVDEQIARYKKAKKHYEALTSSQETLARMRYEVAKYNEKQEKFLTVEQKAQLKALKDYEFEVEHSRYDYATEEEWNEDHDDD